MNFKVALRVRAQPVMSHATTLHQNLLRLKAGQAVPPELGNDAILLLASGGADELSGRYLTVFDDLAMLAATAETIRRNDLLTLRLRQVAQ